jgi:phage terminase small subunit
MKVYGCSEEAARKNGSRLMTNDDIRSEIERRQQEINKKVEEETEISVKWVLDSFKSIAERCMTAEPVLDREGNETGEYKFDSSGANKALENIGKHLGMFTDKLKLDVSGQVNHEHEYRIEQTITTDPDTADLLKQLWRRQSASTA